MSKKFNLGQETKKCKAVPKCMNKVRDTSMALDKCKGYAPCKQKILDEYFPKKTKTAAQMRQDAKELSEKLRKQQKAKREEQKAKQKAKKLAKKKNNKYHPVYGLLRY